MSEQSQKTTHLFLSAVDVWLFRDGRPFDAGSHHRAESLFPPHPSVVQGAIRSYELVRRGINLRGDPKQVRAAVQAAVGDADDPKELRIRGPWLAQYDGNQVRRYFPLPADASMDEEGLFRPASLPRSLPEGVRTNAATPLLMGLDDEPRKAEGGRWLEDRALQLYTQARSSGEGYPIVQSNDLFSREARMSIGVNNTRNTVQEGALFEVEFIRPRPQIGLYLEFEGYTGWPQTGALSLGGESRGAIFTQVSPAKILEGDFARESKALPGRFKVIFITPTYLGNGWLPVAPGWTDFFTGPVTLESAAVTRYESIGGYDAARRDHKPARRLIPAGSVYYFSVPNGSSVMLRPELINRAITDWGAKFGYGQIFIQEW